MWKTEFRQERQQRPDLENTMSDENNNAVTEPAEERRPSAGRLLPITELDPTEKRIYDGIRTPELQTEFLRLLGSQEGDEAGAVEVTEHADWLENTVIPAFQGKVSELRDLAVQVRRGRKKFEPNTQLSPPSIPGVDITYPKGKRQRAASSRTSTTSSGSSSSKYKYDENGFMYTLDGKPVMNTKGEHRKKSGRPSSRQ